MPPAAALLGGRESLQARRGGRQGWSGTLGSASSFVGATQCNEKGAKRTEARAAAGVRAEEGTGMMAGKGLAG